MLGTSQSLSIPTFPQTVFMGPKTKVRGSVVGHGPANLSLRECCVFLYTQLCQVALSAASLPSSMAWKQ